MQKSFLTLVCTIIFSFAFSQSKVQDYIQRFKNIAIEEEIRTGIPASIKLAQGIIETSAGESNLVVRSNNHFGIKCKTEWQGGKVYHDDDAKGECFRSYENPEDSYRDHSDFLLTRSHYAFLFQLDPTDYEGWAKGLKKAGYATNPNYANMLIKVIVDNDLQQYTLLALNQKQKKENNLFAIKPEPGSEQTTVAKLDVEEVKTFSPPVVKNHQAAENSPQPMFVQTSVEELKVNYPQGVFKINNMNVVYAPTGTSLLALASRYNISYQKLLDFNDIEQSDILAKDQLLFLEKKQKKGTKDFHVVQLGETLYDISQREGIRLQNLLLLNKISKGKEPLPGEKIYLRSDAPTAPKTADSGSQVAFAG